MARVLCAVPIHEEAAIPPLRHSACANLSSTDPFLHSAMDVSSKILIGTAGWSYKDWEGVFYPPGMQHRKQHALEYLAQCFDMVEINTSFYGHIKPELAKLWSRKVEAVNPKFRFTA